VLEINAVHMNSRSKSSAPLVSSHIDNVLVNIVPEVNQPLFQFINIWDASLVNTFLHGRPYLIVTWVVFWAVQKPIIQ